ncbi:hypothetical protein DFH09DRAFT_1272188 [Mycena vulgaris]|nr:hypothetical protein DFH09DRAFT_1272188 [Mycena vulgaris]
MSNDTSQSPLIQQRRRVYVACLNCRRRKIKCVTAGDQAAPQNPCDRCTKRGLSCEYRAVSDASAPSYPSYGAPPQLYGASSHYFPLPLPLPSPDFTPPTSSRYPSYIAPSHAQSSIYGSMPDFPTPGSGVHKPGSYPSYSAPPQNTQVFGASSHYFPPLLPLVSAGFAASSASSTRNMFSPAGPSGAGRTDPADPSVPQSADIPSSHLMPPDTGYSLPRKPRVYLKAYDDISEILSPLPPPQEAPQNQSAVNLDSISTNYLTMISQKPSETDPATADTMESQQFSHLPASPELQNLGDSPDATSSLFDDAEPQIATFVIHVPAAMQVLLRVSIRPEDVDLLENHVPAGGNTIAVHKSTHAENWVEQHYDTTLLKSIRSVGVGGPIPTMLSPEVPALAIFGSILDDRVLELAKALSDVSMFSVMVRPAEDDPLAQFMQESREIIDGEWNTEDGDSSEGSDSGTDDENVESDGDDSDSDGGNDYAGQDQGQGQGVFRLRGGAMRQRGQHSMIDDDPDYIVPAGVDRPDGSHRTRVKLHLKLHEKCLYDVAISSKTAFKFQTEKGETPHALSEPITRPQVLSSVDLKVEARPFEVLIDRSYSNLGFTVNRPKSIAGREYLPRGFEPPSATATRGTQKSTENAGSVIFGLDSMQPVLTAKASHSRTTGETVTMADDKPFPSCHVEEQIGKEWDTDGKSYSSYDVSWQPMAPQNGHPRPVNIRFGMGIEFYGKEERYISRLPTISHILRNQIILWVFDPELKAKVRGMIVLTSTYIPDIKIEEPLSIVEEEVIGLAVNRPHDPPPTDSAPLVHDAANSVAIGLFEQPADPGRAKSSIRKLMNRVTPRSSSRKTKRPMLIDLPLHEYIARGWDATNEQWKNTVWPTLDKDFLDAGASPSAAWNLALNPGHAGAICSEALANPTCAVRNFEQGMLVDPPAEKGSGQPLTLAVDSVTVSGSSASNTGGASRVLIDRVVGIRAAVRASELGNHGNQMCTHSRDN